MLKQFSMSSYLLIAAFLFVVSCNEVVVDSACYRDDGLSIASTAEKQLQSISSTNSIPGKVTIDSFAKRTCYFTSGILPTGIRKNNSPLKDVVSTAPMRHWKAVRLDIQ